MSDSLTPGGPYDRLPPHDDDGERSALVDEFLKASWAFGLRRSVRGAACCWGAFALFGIAVSILVYALKPSEFSVGQVSYLAASVLVASLSLIALVWPSPRLLWRFLAVVAILIGLALGASVRHNGLSFDTLWPLVMFCFVCLGVRNFHRRAPAYKSFMEDYSSRQRLRGVSRIFSRLAKTNPKRDSRLITFHERTLLDRHFWKGILLDDGNAVLVKGDFSRTILVARDEIEVEAASRDRRSKSTSATLTLGDESMKVIINSESLRRVEQWQRGGAANN